MGELIQKFTFDRNTMKRDLPSSAKAVAEHIEYVRSEIELEKTASNIVGALTRYMGVFDKIAGKYRISKTGNVFLQLFSQNNEDAFRWLLTRSLWRFVVPNGTECLVNAVAIKLNVRFALFHLILSLLKHLETMSGKARFLFYEELCELLDDDKNWTRSAIDLFLILQSIREKRGLPSAPRRLLGDLEEKYHVSRDNLNGYINKALAQTGLFEYIESGGGPVAIALSASLDDVLQRRVRYIIDHPLKEDNAVKQWEEFLMLQADDLPLETSRPSRYFIESSPKESLTKLDGLASNWINDIKNTGLMLREDLSARIIASLLSKRFLILTGLSGSGKTKIGEAFCCWLSGISREVIDPFIPGREIKSDRISYFVQAADSVSVVYLNKPEGETATKVCLPRELIKEWVAVIDRESFTRETAARTIREAVALRTEFSPQLNSFETHLKAAAFAIIEGGLEAHEEFAYGLIAVGADWTNREPLFGYPDALAPGEYRLPATGFLQLILQAKNNPTRPYFLILDEMNLSHVERYFADVLSAMESEKTISLHEDNAYPEKNWSSVPPEVPLPQNLFIIGTVNVDETTYMFSPKVLDRASVIEFTVSKNEISTFLENPVAIDLDSLAGKGAAYAEIFVESAIKKNVSLEELGQKDGRPVKAIVKEALEALFEELSIVGAEFGYRPAKEISRFIYYYAKVSGEEWKVDDALDAAIIQKLLPKLHGSKTKLGPALEKLKNICKDKYPLSLAKIERMEMRLKQNGFTSFAEA